MARILITGATGFIGRNLVEKLGCIGYQFNGISKRGGMINDILIDAVDCTDQEALKCYCGDKLFNGIIHLAASVPSSFYDETARQSLVQNVKMTMNLLEAFRKQNGGVFVYASSTSIYGYPEKLPVIEETPPHPDGFYPLGKFFGELLCQQYQKEHNLCIAILRISAPYGSRMRRETVIDKFIRKALLSEDITLYGTGSRSQDFTYIEDVVNAMTLAYEAKATGIFNISGGTSTSMEQLAEIILSILPESQSNIIYSGIDDPQEDYHVAFSFEKAREVFSYQPRFSLKEGLQKYVEVIREELEV